jgi:hypothetical protein
VPQIAATHWEPRLEAVSFKDAFASASVIFLVANTSATVSGLPSLARSAIAANAAVDAAWEYADAPGPSVRTFVTLGAAAPWSAPRSPPKTTTPATATRATTRTTPAAAK